MIRCPHCNAEIPLALFTAYLGRQSAGKTSDRKARASRENGKKGGRPKRKDKS